MHITTLRQELRAARDQVEAGDTTQAVARLNQLFEELRSEQLLTTTEAARLLGVRSPNTVKLWRRTGHLHGGRRGGRTMLPLSEIERIQEGDQVWAVQASDQAHDTIEESGVAEGLTDDDLADLATARPGKNPWERQAE
jgi:hypothetical protein